MLSVRLTFALMARIELSLGMFSLVDDADYRKVSALSWFLGSNGYATHSIRGGSHVTLHRFLFDNADGLDIDHVNGDRLDNRKSSNLRPCSRSENALNSHDKWLVISRFIGVYRRSIWDRWFVQVPIGGGSQYYVGDYEDEAKAAHAYDDAVVFYGGPVVKTNFPMSQPRSQRDLLMANGQCSPPLSGFRGVSTNGGPVSRGHKQKWGASIYVGRKYMLGYFQTQEEAAAVYDAAAFLLGKPDRMNFPGVEPSATAIEQAIRAINPDTFPVAA
jgi:hypothetical protein